MRPRLVICSQYFPMRYGIAVAARRQALGLHALGWDLEIVTTTCAEPGQSQYDPFPIHRNPPRRKMMEICRSAQAVIVEGDALVHLLPAAASGTPFLVVHHCQRPARLFHNAQVDPIRVGFWWRLARYFLVRHYLRKARYNVSVSARTAELLRLPNSAVIPNAVEIDAFPEIAPAQLHPDRRRRIGYVGRLSGEKGVDVALRVLAGLQDKSVVLDIYGDGPLRSQFEQLARSLGVDSRVVFHGFVERAALNAAYRNVRCVLVPSNWEEPFCMVAAEAMCCGTPVVGSDRGGLPTTIGPGGYCHSLADIDAWIDSTRRFLDSDEFYSEAAERGRRHVLKNFTIEAVAQQFDGYLRQMIGDAATTHRLSVD